MDFMIFPFVMIVFCVVMFVMMRGMGRMHGGDQTLLWSGKMGCCGLNFSPWNERADRTQSWWRQQTTSGNRTFDEYRTETLRRFEQEQRDFRTSSPGCVWPRIRPSSTSSWLHGKLEMNRSALAPSLMIAFALIGLAVALYDAYSIYNGQLLWCPPPVNGCNEVAASPYARIFDLPVGYYGVVYYAYVFGLAALLAYDPLSSGRRIVRRLSAASGS